MKNKLLFIIASFVMLATDTRAQDSWAQKANFLAGERYSSFCFSIGDKAYVGTGVDNYGVAKSDFWEYDASADTWTQKADFGAGIRMYATGFSIGNKGYPGTGAVASYDWRKDMWQYDPLLNAWTQVADFAGGFRYSTVAFAIGNKGYMGTGNYRVSPWYDATYYNDFWEYDPVPDIWTQKANVPEQGRCGAIGISIGNKGYIGMGFYYYDTRLKDFWEYDPATDTWLRRADLPGTERFSPSAFTIGNKGYVGAGYYYSELTDFWEFNPATNNWIQKASLAAGRTANIFFSIGNKGYTGLGSNSAGALSDLWEYIPSAEAKPSVSFDATTVSTYAGNTIAGLTDGADTSAAFNYPVNTATDISGNVFVADHLNHSIRKISTDGKVTTIAGNGTAGYADGIGTAAQFSLPAGLTTDLQGNIYVADEGNNRIRKITAAGMVSTLAGNGWAGYADGPGNTAQFNRPAGVSADKSGNVYVADVYNERIRKITAAGIVTTVAGNGELGQRDGPGTDAQFAEPNGIAIDGEGNLYVSELYGPLRKINNAGMVSTIHTTGNEFDTFQDGVAIDASGNIFMSIWLNANHSYIYKITPAGSRAIVAGGINGYQDGNGTNAQFYYATGVSTYGHNLYVADPYNNRIRKLTPPAIRLASSAGTVSEAQSFGVSGTNLTGNINCSAPNGYEISLVQENGYSSALALPSSAGEIVSTTVFIRLKNNLAAGIYSGNITLTADDAATQILQVTGVVTDTIAPLIQCPPAQIFCFDAVNHYTVPAITTIDISGIKSIEYTISGATARTGTGANASGIFYPGLNSIVWTVKDNAENTSTCSITVRINTPLNLTVPDAYPLLIWGDANTIYKGFGPTCATLIALPSGGTKLPGHKYNYKWSTGANTPIITVCPNETGNHTYTLTVTDSLGCTVSVTKTIKVIDVRCGTNMNKVLVCRQGNTQACLTNGQAALALLFGARLGSCSSIPFAARSASTNKETMVENDNVIKVFPNPTTGIFTVQPGNTDAREIKLVDMNGKIIYRKMLNGINRSPSIQINPGKIANGLYLVQVLTNKELFSSTIIVQQ